ncbi:MAG: bifunctional adenosylcobinamide kinase/adenosylcobinamide-phosphate guanylyltransferase [Planctomycetes bacterium]|nr:bifunctional adenosylcobinamide kinase/adenosylcobinamide-phosphate guanylyltransferase [Planctomycetota bacterium]
MSPVDGSWSTVAQAPREPSTINHQHATLFLGGARSGKSRLAQQWIEAQAPLRRYCATCRRDPADAEMAARIQRHRDDRAGRGWDTVEEALDPAAVVAASDRPLLIDCATLWLCNLGDARAWDEPSVLAEVDRLCRVLAAPPVAVAVVSNEVGSGVVPEHALGRQFRDLQGWANQRLAAACARAALVVAGLPLWLKGAP